LSNKRIEYFSETWNKIQDAINSFIEKMSEKSNSFDIIKIHINRETLLEGYICVNGYILYQE